MCLALEVSRIGRRLRGREPPHSPPDTAVLLIIVILPPAPGVRLRLELEMRAFAGSLFESRFCPPAAPAQVAPWPVSALCISEGESRRP